MGLKPEASEELQIVAYVTVSFLALFIYDWFISLTQEVVHIWHSRWGVIKILYFWTRYVPFIVMIIAAQERISSMCNHQTLTTVFAGFIIGISDLILMLRTYSIFNKSRRVLAVICLSWIVLSAIATWAVFRFSSESFSSDSSTTNSCFVPQRSKAVLIAFFALLGGECVTSLLTAWKTLDIYRKSHFGQALSTIYHEGLFYYFMILPTEIAIVTVFLLSPAGFQSLMDSPLTVLHSILCCKLVLHVREIAAKRDGEDEDEDSDEVLPAFVIEGFGPSYLYEKRRQYYV
ncbi:hypothetical protein FB446DRAFT_732125 [Lentinula raphanica]|nr:hypothetical protein FB446DRAFT_732125 [Lentinula raphanica]